MKPCGCDVRRTGGPVLCLRAAAWWVGSRLLHVPGREEAWKQARMQFRRHTDVWPEDVRLDESEGKTNG